MIPFLLLLFLILIFGKDEGDTTVVLVTPIIVLILLVCAGKVNTAYEDYNKTPIESSQELEAWFDGQKTCDL